MMSTALAVIAALLLDHCLGEPKRWHPLVAFGAWANALERTFNPQGQGARSAGLWAWALAVLPLTAVAWLLTQIPYLGFLIEVGLLYLAIGLRSLSEHVQPIIQALQAHDLDEARRRVGYIVSRETQALEADGVARAATESVLENGSDAVFAALFWFVVAGVLGVVLYRLSNTLDAMWGYKNARFLHFGWAAARIDDGLNYIPARLTAFSYALCGHTRTALHCWHTQAPLWDSPNAGPVMAAGAGALGVRLGGTAVYGGTIHQRPDLGAGSAPEAKDIQRALRLLQRVTGLWLALLLLGGLLGGWLYA